MRFRFCKFGKNDTLSQIGKFDEFGIIKEKKTKNYRIGVWLIVSHIF